MLLACCLLLGLVACSPAKVPDQGNVGGGADGGNSGSGNGNSDANTGTGDSNTGTGTGDVNTGNGDSNTGSGDANTGSGDSNTGNNNGNGNTGSGDSGSSGNSGNNTGAGNGGSNENAGSGSTENEKKPSAVAGTLTGKDSLDVELKAIIDSVTNAKESKLEQMRAVYKWVADNFRYRAVTVDLSQGYTDALKIELTEYFLKYRRASCEHYATTVALLFQLLDPAYQPIMVTGERWDVKNQVWGEHAWVIMEYEGRYYHFDGLYGKNHQGDTFRSFMKTDAEMAEHHKWDATQYPACS